MFLRFLPLVFLVVFSTSTLHAQARLAIYGSIGGEKSGLPNSGWSKAGVVGLYADAANLGPVAIAVDVRGDFATNNRSLVVGPRLALHFPAFPLKPYSELLVGRTSYDKTSTGFSVASEWNVSYVGGIDTTIFPHLDWRLFDFSYKLPDSGGTDHQKALTTGIVIRF